MGGKDKRQEQWNSLVSQTLMLVPVLNADTLVLTSASRERLI